MRTANPSLKPLTAKACRKQAAECRKAAKSTMTKPQRIMLDHIAGTWLRIAADIDKANQ
jgi:hypothetical protein